MGTAFFLNGQRVGQGRVHLAWDDAGNRVDASFVLVCPFCGNPWGRIETEAAFNYVPLRSRCPRHPTPSEPGGSFLFPWRQQQLGELPPEVLAYECRIRLDHHFKEQQNE